MTRFSVHYKRPKRRGLHSITVFAKDAAEASRKVKGWFSEGWQEYGITRHADDSPITLSDADKVLLRGKFW